MTTKDTVTQVGLSNKTKLTKKEKKELREKKREERETRDEKELREKKRREKERKRAERHRNKEERKKNKDKGNAVRRNKGFLKVRCRLGHRVHLGLVILQLALFILQFLLLELSEAKRSRVTRL